MSPRCTELLIHSPTSDFGCGSALPRHFFSAGRGPALRAEVLENLKAAVEAAGGTMDDICRVDVYVRNMEHFESIHKVRREYFNAEFSKGVENIAWDSQTGFNSAICLRTVKLKDFPWNGWLRLGIAGRPAYQHVGDGGLFDNLGTESLTTLFLKKIPKGSPKRGLIIVIDSAFPFGANAAVTGEASALKSNAAARLGCGIAR